MIYIGIFTLTSKVKYFSIVDVQYSYGFVHSIVMVHIDECFMTALQEGSKFPYFTLKPNISGLPGPTEISQYSNENFLCPLSGYLSHEKDSMIQYLAKCEG